MACVHSLEEQQSCCLNQRVSEGLRGEAFRMLCCQYGVKVIRGTGQKKGWSKRRLKEMWSWCR